jgi:hypothetical protein
MGDPGHLYLATPGKTQPYELTGNTAALAKYDEREVSLKGSVNETTRPWPSFDITAVEQVFDLRQPTLNSSFTDSSLWQHERDRKYGIVYAHPPAWPRIALRIGRGATGFRRGG